MSLCVRERVCVSVCQREGAREREAEREKACVYIQRESEREREGGGKRIKRQTSQGLGANGTDKRKP